MSYLVLARKFRPQSFDEVVGQQAIVRTLQNSLERARVPHALIFSGVRGVGKTTLARIMAKALNCEKGPSPTPCNTCGSCLSITSGSSVDLHEIDGASNRGIQEIRELKEKIRFLPTGARYKIFIIDEVHMLTSEAFNALLKTLEEPPDHVYFIFATTELHKVPITILSRCQRYELKRISYRDLVKHFGMLAEKENVTVEPAAMDLIAREAGGSIRDGLSLLDQILSYCGGRVNEKDVVDVLGLVSHQVIRDIGSALLSGNLAVALERLDGVYSYGMDFKRFINDLLNWFRGLVICKIVKEPRQLLDLPDEETDYIEETAKGYSAESLILMFNNLMGSLEKANFSSSQRLALEMAFIKAVQTGEVVPTTEIIYKLDQLLQGIPVTDDASAVVEDSEYKESLSEDNKSSSSLQPSSQSAPEVKEEIRESLDKKKLLAESSSSPPSKNVRQHWNDFIDYVRERKLWMASVLERAKSVQLDGEKLIINYTNCADYGLLKNKKNLKPLTEFALDFFQENFKIQFKSPDENDSGEKSGEETGPQKMRSQLTNDYLVQTALEIFNGRIGDIRVGPRFRKIDNNKIDNKDNDQ